MGRPKQINSTGTKLTLRCGPVMIDLRITGEITIVHREGTTPAIEVSKAKGRPVASKTRKKAVKAPQKVDAFQVEETDLIE